MLTHGGFLKGMNLGKHHRIDNEGLRAAVEASGLADAQTFRASGNVAFDGGRRSDASLRKALEKGLQEQLGYAVPTFIRSAAELRKMAEEQPFDLDGAKGKLQVVLLQEAPAAKARKRVLALASEDDQLAFGPAELYWLPIGSMMDSVLDWKAIERELGATTTRTKGTIEAFVAKFFAT